VWARVLDGRRYATVQAKLPGRRGTLESRVVLRDDLPASASAETRIGLGGGTAFNPARVPEGEPAARLDLLVTRRLGSPASGATVRLDGEGWRREVELDPAGRVSLTDLRPGPITISVREVGFVFATEEADLRAGRKTRIHLREPEGRRILVTVREKDGSPASFAALLVKLAGGGPEYVPMEGDVQHVRLRADVEGRRVITGVPPGGVRIRAVQGARFDERPVGEDGVVELEL
jgi:hypothetical protein